MWAMIPMLRSLASALSAEATVIPTSSLDMSRAGRSPALVVRPALARRLPPVVGKRLVRLGHLVRVLAPLHRGTEAVARVEQLVLQPLDHRLLEAGLRVLRDPPQPEGHLARRPNLDRHLVGRATNAAAADLEGRLDVVHRTLERHDRVGAGLLAAAFERAVHDPLSERALALRKDLVDQL